MKPCVIQKVAFRLPQSSRLVWALILAERESLALLFVQRQQDGHPNKLYVATLNVPERVYESVSVSNFPVENEDLVAIGAKLSILGDGMSENELDQWLKSEGLWGNE